MWLYWHTRFLAVVVAGDVDLSLVISRISDGWLRSIDCGEGWWPIIQELDEKLNEVDPGYVIYQIKEKFGQLRFYYAPSSPVHSVQMGRIVDHYSAIASKTCEISGEPGYLMRRDQPFGTFKTLAMPYHGNGWTIVDTSQRSAD